MELLSLLAPLRAHGGARTHGLDDATVTAFAARHADLRDAIAAAGTEYAHVRAELPELMDLDERARLVADLGDTDAMLLRNHGTLVVGRTVAEAFNLIYFLEMACRYHDAPTAQPSPSGWAALLHLYRLW